MKNFFNVILITVFLCVTAAGCGNKAITIERPPETENETSDRPPEISQQEYTQAPVTIPSNDTQAPLNDMQTPSADTQTPAEEPPESPDEVRDYHNLDKIGIFTDDWQYDLIKAFIEKDTEVLEQMLNLPEGTYSSYKTIELSGYSIKWVELDNYIDPCIQLSFNISKSNNEALMPGKHSLILTYDDFTGIMLRKGGEEQIVEYTPAYAALGWFFGCSWFLEVPDFEIYYKQNKDEAQSRLTHYLVSARTGGEWIGVTEKDVIESAKKYLNISGFEPDPAQKHEDGKYYHGGHGGTDYSIDIISEKTLAGVTTITIQYYADWAKTVYSHLIEYNLMQLDDGYMFLPSKTIKKSLLKPVMYSF